MKKWKWRSRRRPDQGAMRGKNRQMVKVKIRAMIPGEEDVLHDGDGGISAKRAGRHHNALAA